MQSSRERLRHGNYPPGRIRTQVAAPPVARLLSRWFRSRAWKKHIAPGTVWIADGLGRPSYGAGERAPSLLVAVRCDRMQFIGQQGGRNVRSDDWRRATARGRAAVPALFAMRAPLRCRSRRRRAGILPSHRRGPRLSLSGGVRRGNRADPVATALPVGLQPPLRLLHRRGRCIRSATGDSFSPASSWPTRLPRDASSGARNIQWVGGSRPSTFPAILAAMAGCDRLLPVVWKSNFLWYNRGVRSSGRRS